MNKKQIKQCAFLVLLIMLVPSIAFAGDSAQIFAYFVYMMIAAVIVFLMLREFWCWYWKINSRQEKLEVISTDLRRIIEHLESSGRHEKEIRGNMSIGNEPEKMLQSLQNKFNNGAISQEEYNIQREEIIRNI